jgi:hypothetical protein
VSAARGDKGCIYATAAGDRVVHREAVTARCWRPATAAVAHYPNISGMRQPMTRVLALTSKQHETLEPARWQQGR